MVVEKRINRSKVVQRFQEFLLKRGLKLTQQRRAVLEAALALECHFGPENLEVQTRRQGRRVHRATIYRILPLLEASGMVRRIYCSEDGTYLYEHAIGHVHHDHLRCLECGKVIEVQRPSLEKEQQAVCAKHGFEALEHRFWVIGYCTQCQKKRRKKR